VSSEALQYTTDFWTLSKSAEKSFDEYQPA
jgi:hypothetical protein